MSNDGQLTMLLVGLHPHELMNYERGLLDGKRVVEAMPQQDWRTMMKEVQADEIIIKHNSGFVGLYTPSGMLVKSIDMHDGSNYASADNQKSPVQRRTYLENFDYGYTSGGRIDPYQPRSVVVEPMNNSSLAAGWGYNNQLDQPKSKRSTLMTFLNFAPLEVGTPLNYPGTFDQSNLTVAYGLGVIPHIGGLIASSRRAKAEKQDYEYYKQQQPLPYVEYPVGPNAQATNYQAQRQDLQIREQQAPSQPIMRVPQSNAPQMIQQQQQQTFFDPMAYGSAPQNNMAYNPNIFPKGNRTEATNPIYTDPRAVMLNPPPQSFKNQFGNYMLNPMVNMGFGAANRAYSD